MRSWTLKAVCWAILGCSTSFSEARGIDTFVPLSFAMPPVSGLYVVTSRQVMPDAYVDAPQPRIMCHPP